MIVVNCQINVCQRLRLYPLSGVDHQDRTFAGGKRAADFIGKVNVAGGVHQVELVGFAVFRGIVEADGLGFDGNAAFALNVHGIEHLFLHFAAGKATAVFDQTVGQGRFSVVDVGDDGKVANKI